MYLVQWNCQASGLLYSPVILPAGKIKNLTKTRERAKMRETPKPTQNKDVFSYSHVFSLWGTFKKRPHSNPPFRSLPPNLGKINWTKNTTVPELQSDGEQCPGSAGWCQTAPGHIWPRRHEAGRGRKVKSAAGGKERNTRVGIVGILAAQPVQLPVICFVVNSDSWRGVEGGLWLAVLLDTSRRLSRPCLQGLECRFCASVPGLSAYNRSAVTAGSGMWSCRIPFSRLAISLKGLKRFSFMGKLQQDSRLGPTEATVRKITTFCRVGELYLTITGVKSAGVDF